VNLADADLDAFRAALRDGVVMPEQSGFMDKPIFNAMHQRRPALIVRCAGTADVVTAVKFARQHGLLVAVRGGGHSVAGHSSCDGGLVIDLTRMRGVDVDPDARIARVQGGALWADVDRETQAYGLVVPGGVVSETGVAGLTLGGGEGWVRRKYGLTIDSLLSARVVCADGSVRTASPTSEPDLFWALRGGGGNFGIVTSFEFRAHPLGPIVAFAGVFYPVADAERVLPRWRDYCVTTPDEVTSVAVAISFPADPPPSSTRSQPRVSRRRRRVCRRRRGRHAGDAAPSRLRHSTRGHLAADAVFGCADRLRRVLSDGEAPELLEGAASANAFRRRYRRHSGPGQSPALTAYARRDFPHGGAINRVESTETAYAERSAPWMSSIDGNWENPADNAANIVWVRESFKRITPYPNGVTYTSFTGQADETASALTAHAYGANMERLQRVKAQYDPDNFFRLNPNVIPASTIAT